jgi:hypothetical protein
MNARPVTRRLVFFVDRMNIEISKTTYELLVAIAAREHKRPTELLDELVLEHANAIETNPPSSDGETGQ